jgi:hypothetical protein
LHFGDKPSKRQLQVSISVTHQAAQRGTNITMQCSVAKIPIQGNSADPAPVQANSSYKSTLLADYLLG